MWDEITYAFSNLNGAAVEVWECIINFIQHFTGHVITDPSWDLKLIHVDNAGPWQKGSSMVTSVAIYLTIAWLEYPRNHLPLAFNTKGVWNPNMVNISSQTFKIKYIYIYIYNLTSLAS